MQRCEYNILVLVEYIFPQLLPVVIFFSVRGISPLLIDGVQRNFIEIFTNN